MRRLLKRKKLLHTVAFLSAILGAISIAGIIFCILKLWYIPMALCIAVTAHGFYGCPFYFIAYSNICRTEKILAAIVKGNTDISLIAESAGVSTEYAKKLIKKAAEKKYLKIS